MLVPSGESVRPFIEERHREDAARLGRWVEERLVSLPPAEDDSGARDRARKILVLLGYGGWLDALDPLELRSVSLVREALAWASPLADAVFALQALGTTPLTLAGDESQRRRWVAPALEGKAMAAFAMTEADAGSDVAAIATRARRDGKAYVLTGEKTFISNAGIADFYTVFASTAPELGRKGISCFVVPAETPGFRFVRPQRLSEPHPLGVIAFEECRVPVAHRVGREGDGFRIGMEVLDRLRPTVAAAACGMAARALDEAMDHATKREQFGRPISDFQLVQQKLARMHTELEAARLLTYRAAWLYDGGAERITLEAAAAKAFATEAAQRIVDDAVQVLGGRGVLADHPVDHLYRAVRALRIYEGTTEIQHLIIAKRLLADRPGGGGDR